MDENEKALRDALNECSPKPWRRYEEMVIDANDIGIARMVHLGAGRHEADHAFIVAARNAVPGMLAELDRLRAIEAAARRYETAHDVWESSREFDGRDLDALQTEADAWTAFKAARSELFAALDAARKDGAVRCGARKDGAK